MATMARTPPSSNEDLQRLGASPPVWVGLGMVLAVSIQILVAGGWRLLTKRRRAAIQNGDAMYGLDHGKLNLALPPRSMWMNMGFWRDVEPEDFEGACRALLSALLDQAGLLEARSGEESRKSRDLEFRKDLQSMSVLDVGFGCGDQTLAITKAASNTNLQYLGITLNHAQFTCAQLRVSQSPYQGKSHDVSLFLADAAKPDSWTSSCLEKAAGLIINKHQAGWDTAPTTKTATILLALDTLYHFSPSRLPLLTYAAKTLRADLAAFDILLSPTATPWQALKLRLIGRLSGCPWSAFKSEREYRALLIAAGCQEESIVITDITEHVFGPLAAFVGRQEARLEQIGLKMGSLRVAGWLFGWWARSKVVRGVLVTAKAS